MQKNDQKHNTVIHGQMDDATLCPALQWACIVNQIRTYQGSTPDTPVCVVWHHDKLDNILSKHVLTALRAACAAIGSTHLCFEQSKMGTHSLCSGTAMEMYLTRLPVYTIILIGRWLSNTLLCYIRKQVEQISQNVAKQMLTFRSFQTTPDITPLVVSNKDPRQCNHHNNAETRHNIGHGNLQRMQLPSFSLFNWSMSTWRMSN